MKHSLTKFEELKRNLYLWILPILFIALCTSYLYNSTDDKVNSIAIPVLIISYSLSWILMYIRRAYRFVELFNLLIISIFHLFKFNEVVSVGMGQNQQITAGTSPFWTPLLFVFIFVTLRGKKGFIFSILLWLSTVTIGFMHWSDIPYLGTEVLIQYNLSSLAYIIFLFFARYIIRAYTESELLNTLAFQDALTGIANRRQIYDWLEDALKKEEAFSVIFFDIDHFKKVNDELGHVVGDKLLMELTTLINQNIDEKDHFGRWGGEEFLIISNQTKLESIKIAEQLRELVASYYFSNIAHVTISVGVDEVQKGDTVETLVNRVDEALYRAKQLGRNQVNYI